MSALTATVRSLPAQTIRRHARAKGRPKPASVGLSPMERRLLDEFQYGLPLSPTPYAEMAARLGVTEEQVLASLRALKAKGIISRVGAVFRPNRIGASTLAAMRVPRTRLAEVAAVVSGYSEVNHNYERDHRFNLWFVVTAPSRERVQAVLEEISQRTGLLVMDLPMLKDYHIDLAFPLWR